MALPGRPVRGGSQDLGGPTGERKLRGLLRTVQRVDPSRIVLLWAAYGAGKTHALRYLAHLAAGHEDVRALYVVTPKGIKHFLDVYRAVVDAALRSDLISELGLALYRRSGPEQPTNLRRALVRIVGLNEPQTQTPVSWLKAEKISATELRSSGLTRRLETRACTFTEPNGLLANDQTIYTATVSLSH